MRGSRIRIYMARWSAGRTDPDPMSIWQLSSTARRKLSFDNSVTLLGTILENICRIGRSTAGVDFAAFVGGE